MGLDGALRDTSLRRQGEEACRNGVEEAVDMGAACQLGYSVETVEICHGSLFCQSTKDGKTQ